MEIFIDFGLFELLGILGLVKLARLTLDRVRSTLAGSSAKLGWCNRRMAITAVGLCACSVAAAWANPPASPFIRWPIYVAWLAFVTVAVLHVWAMLYRALTRVGLPFVLLSFVSRVDCERFAGKRNAKK